MAAALALGAQGVWSGTLWLTVEEADIPPRQMETYLAAVQPGHGAVPLLHRQAVPDAPQRLDRGLGGRGHARTRCPMPLQMMVAIEAVSPRPPLPRAGQGRELQPVRPGHRPGHDQVRKAKDVVFSMVEEFIEATERLQSTVSV